MLLTIITICPSYSRRSPACWRVMAEANDLIFQEGTITSFDPSGFDVIILSHVLLDFGPEGTLLKDLIEGIMSPSNSSRNRMLIITDRRMPDSGLPDNLHQSSNGRVWPCWHSSGLRIGNRTKGRSGFYRVYLTKGSPSIHTEANERSSTLMMYST